MRRPTPQQLVNIARLNRPEIEKRKVSFSDRRNTCPQQQPNARSNGVPAKRHTIARAIVDIVEDSHFIAVVIELSGHRNETAEVGIIVVTPSAATNDAERANVGRRCHLEVEVERLDCARGFRRWHTRCTQFEYTAVHVVISVFEFMCDAPCSKNTRSM